MLGRIKAWWQYRQLIRNMRNTWHVVRYSGSQHHFSQLIMYGEENELGERRIRIEYSNYAARRFTPLDWANYKAWQAGAQPVMPPRHAPQLKIGGKANA